MAMSPNNYSVKFPVYQIDFSAAASGKRVAATKRRIRWRFGFPNKAALDGGRTGTDCRGEEHDVTIVWSITSGKRQISMDGREIHYSSSRAGILDFSWTTKGNHVIKVACHAAAPLSPTPGFRQYDLFVDGQSFFNMPKVYELGIKGPIPAHARVPGYGYSNPTSPISMESVQRSIPGPANREQEDTDLKRAIEASIQESRMHLDKGGSAGGAQTADLLAFDGPPQPSPSDARSLSGMSNYSAPTTYNPVSTPQQLAPALAPTPPYQAQPYQSPGQPPVPSPAVSAGALVPSHGPPGAYYQAPPTTPSYAGGPPPSFASPASVPPAPTPAPTPAAYAPPQAATPNSFTSPPPQGGVFGLNSGPGDDPFAPKPPAPPTQQDFASAILGAYQSPPPTTPGAEGVVQQNGATPQQPQGSPAQPMSMNALTPTAADEAPVSDFDKALRNLVNVDHIDEPAEGDVKLTMIKKEEEKKKQPKNKSKPLPPVAVTIVGQGATLGQIKDTQHGESTIKQTADGVMNAPPPGVFTPGAAAGGALVVHGQGPPPLQQPMGFGLGAQMPNGGFAHQQQAPMGFQQQYR